MENNIKVRLDLENTEKKLLKEENEIMEPVKKEGIIGGRSYRRRRVVQARNEAPQAEKITEDPTHIVEILDNEEINDETIDHTQKRKSKKKTVKDPNQPKKKPGRPKKKVDAVPTEIKGISDKPQFEENIIELVYPNSKLFKKLFGMYRSYTVNEITFKFMDKIVQIVNRNHQGNTNTYMKIFCHRLPHYYCGATMSVTVKREDLEKIFKTLDKANYRITFTLKHEFYRSVLHIIVYDCEMDKQDEYEVEIIRHEAAAEFDEPDDTNYPLKFVLPSKHFKSIISRTCVFSDTLVFQKNGVESLEITNEAHQRVNINSSYRNPEKIKLVCNLAADDMFSVTVPISNIKPFSNLAIGDNVYIAADNIRKIGLMTEIDRVKTEVDGKQDEGPVCQLKIFAEIKRYFEE